MPATHTPCQPYSTSPALHLKDVFHECGLNAAVVHCHYTRDACSHISLVYPMPQVPHRAIKTERMDEAVKACPLQQEARQQRRQPQQVGWAACVNENDGLHDKNGTHETCV
eukprot:640531-Pelagomonas_calceolata.AAC.1